MRCFFLNTQNNYISPGSSNSTFVMAKVILTLDNYLNFQQENLELKSMIVFFQAINSNYIRKVPNSQGW